jgi:hypothetical protein
VPRNFFLILLSLSNPDIQLVEFLHVLFHYHTLLPQVLQLLEQIYLILFGHEFSLHISFHLIQILYLMFSFSSPLSLQFIPPQCFMSFQSGDSMSHLFFLIDIFIVEIFVHGSYPIQQFFSIQTVVIHCDVYLVFSSQFKNCSQQVFFDIIFSCNFFDLYFFTLYITDVPNIRCSPLQYLHRL